MEVLSGIRCLEFTAVLAGPWTGETLAQFGAEVIKVESRDRLDLMRRSGLRTGDGSTAIRPYVPGQPIPKDWPTDTASSNWIGLNKFGITLNLREPEAIELAKKLISISDVLIENYRPGVMDKLGLGYPVARDLKPDIVYASMSGAGYNAACLEATQPGYGALFNALGGLGHLSGYPDEPPTQATGRPDMIAGTTFALSIVMALVQRQGTGEGQHVDMSSREAVSYLLGDSFMDYALNNQHPTRDANRDSLMLAPYNCYRCRDGGSVDHWVSIAIATEKEWKAFCAAIGTPEWTEDHRFNDGYVRWQNQEELDKLIESWTINHTDYEVMEILQPAGVAAVPSFSIDEIWNDRHLQARDVFQMVDHPVLGGLPVIKSPYRLSLTPSQIKRHGTMLGQYNEYVFGDLLGLPRQRICELTEKRVFW